MAARFRKFPTALHAEPGWQELFEGPPCNQVMAYALVVGPQTTSSAIPGLFKVGEMAFAELLNWDLCTFRAAFGAAVDADIVMADWDARLVYVPCAIYDNLPESPNVVKSWRNSWAEMRTCALKWTAWHDIHEALEEYGEAFAETFAEACPKPPINPPVMFSGKRSPKGRANQENLTGPGEPEQETRGGLTPPEPPGRGGLFFDQPADAAAKEAAPC